MEMTHHVRSSIEFEIASDGIIIQMYNELKCIDGTSTCHYAIYVYSIMIILQFKTRSNMAY